MIFFYSFKISTVLKSLGISLTSAVLVKHLGSTLGMVYIDPVGIDGAIGLFATNFILDQKDAKSIYIYG